jgi:hypothetical protein
MKQNRDTITIVSTIQFGKIHQFMSGVVRQIIRPSVYYIYTGLLARLSISILPGRECAISSSTVERTVYYSYTPVGSARRSNVQTDLKNLSTVVQEIAPFSLRKGKPQQQHNSKYYPYVITRFPSFGQINPYGKIPNGGMCHPEKQCVSSVRVALCDLKTLRHKI